MQLKKCRVCGKEIPKLRDVSRSRYGKKKYCSQKCYRHWMAENKEGWWKRLDFKNKKLTADDVNALEALKEFGYIK